MALITEKETIETDDGTVERTTTFDTYKTGESDGRKQVGAVVEALVSPTDEWRRLNQGVWLVVPATATAGATVEVKATNLPEETASLTFTVGGADLSGDISGTTASVSVGIDVGAQAGDTLQVIATHPTYGRAEKVVVVVGS